MTIELKCPNCGGTVVAQDTVREVFCTYCGTKFPVCRTAATEAENQAFVRSAYGAGEFQEVLRSVGEGEQDPVLRAYAAAASIRGAYVDYLAKAQELYNKRSAKSGLMQLVTGRNSFAEDPVHVEFFEGVRDQCAALAREGEFLADNAEYGELCGHVVAQMLRRKSADADVSTYWSECALEQETIPLLRFLNTEMLLEFYADYIAFHKPHELLPNQQQAEKAMKQELENRGIKPPKRPGFSDKLKNLFGGKTAG